MAVSHRGKRRLCNPAGNRFEPLEARQLLSVADPTTANAAYVEAVYQDVLSRSAAAAELNQWTQWLNQGELHLDFTAQVVRSDESLSHVVRSAYHQYLGRDVDAAGLNYWLPQMRAGLRDETLAAVLVASDEFFAKAGGSNRGWLDAAYHSLLGRAVDPLASTHFLNELAAGSTRGEVAEVLTTSLEYEQRQVEDDYTRLLGSPADANGLSFWSSQLAAGQQTRESLTGLLLSLDAYYQSRTGISPTVVPVPVDLSAWRAANHQIDQQAQQGNAQLLFIGDSITQFWSSTGQDVWNTDYAGAEALNAGIAGDRTQNVLWRLDTGGVSGISPKVAVVMVGINNLVYGSTPAETADGIQAVMQTLRAELPTTRILLLGILPAGSMSPTASLREEITATNQMIQGLADGQNVVYLDMGPAFTSADGTIKPELFQPGLVHPNADGYVVWAETMNPYLQALLTAASSQSAAQRKPF